MDKAVTANHQLRHPSEMPDKRNTFLKILTGASRHAISASIPRCIINVSIEDLSSCRRQKLLGANRNK